MTSIDYKTWIVRHLIIFCNFIKKLVTVLTGITPNSEENLKLFFCFSHVLKVKCCFDTYIDVNDTPPPRFEKTYYKQDTLRLLRCELDVIKFNDIP